MSRAANAFAQRVVDWQRRQGRHDLPWQNTRDPYRVWLSEIMLQQTQVATVKEYFARFLTRFPDVQALAQAHQDEVMGLWSGLGYYSRARNLHRCAQVVMSEHGGQFPDTAERLAALPGIGPSTAAAVASLCFLERSAILDGNVRRVLTRYLGFDADLATAKAQQELWGHATRFLPQRAEDMPAYTQGMMDLGATLCVRSKPDCKACPLAASCVAHQEGRPAHYPVMTRKLRRSAESHWMLLAVNADGDVWLEQRPDKGIWARLFCLPMLPLEPDLWTVLSRSDFKRVLPGHTFTHVLTHKDLHLHPVQLWPKPGKRWPMAGMAEGRWVSAREWPGLGLPAPVRTLLMNALDSPNGKAVSGAPISEPISAHGVASA